MILHDALEFIGLAVHRVCWSGWVWIGCGWPGWLHLPGSGAVGITANARPKSCKPPIHTWVSVMAQAFWSLLGRPGAFWIVLERPGAFWNVLGHSGAFFWGRDDVCAASGDNLSSLINSIVDSTMEHAPEELLHQSAGPYAHATTGTLVTSWESTFCDVLGTDWLSMWTLQSWPTAVPFKREFVVKALESLRFAPVTQILEHATNRATLSYIVRA